MTGSGRGARDRRRCNPREGGGGMSFGSFRLTHWPGCWLAGGAEFPGRRSVIKTLSGGIKSGSESRGLDTGAGHLGLPPVPSPHSMHVRWPHLHMSVDTQSWWYVLGSVPQSPVPAVSTRHWCAGMHLLGRGRHGRDSTVPADHAGSECCLWRCYDETVSRPEEGREGTTTPRTAACAHCACIGGWLLAGARPAHA